MDNTTPRVTHVPPERATRPARAEVMDRASRRWLTLAGLTVVTFLLLLDDTAVAVAQPTIQRRLGLNLEGLQWVVNVYTLTIAAFILLAGQLADRFGRRRVYLTGLAVFTLSSLGAGLASSGALLIAMRAVQGFGAALVTPTALAIIADVFPRSQRATALGIWAGVSASALGLGPLVGAIINDSLGWRWIFLINTPVGVGVWLLARVVLREDHAPRPSLRLDAVGAVISGAGLLALVLGLTQANSAGWVSLRTVALFVGAGLCLALFIRHERLTAEPLLQLSLFKDRAFAGANIQILLATSVMCSLFFFLALYLQTVLNYSALEAGSGLLPLTVTIVVVGPFAGRLADRIGPRIPVSIGMLLLAGALLGLSDLRVDSSISSLVPWLTLAGLAIGMVTAPTTATAMGSTDTEGHGSAAVVFSTFQTTGLTLGIAIMGAILASFGPGAAFARTISDAHHQAFVRGFSTALTLNAVIALLAAIIALVMLRPTRRHSFGGQ
ncbi:MFS transporter [Nocardioides ferulae]|uniref:MFS transporter n=1 Tax=Nocardioides ferulae TaxID=2340821 RepID=UPI000EB34EF6|nr:MFS transporter [Nocardioides ferulae]